MNKFFTLAFLAFIFFSPEASAQQAELPEQEPIVTDNYNLPWPSWVFEHWVWEDESTMESALTLVNDYHAHNIPVSAIIIDSPWETGYNTFEWDTSLYPQPQLMIDSLHNMDVKVIMWITGIINIDVQPLYDYADSAGYFMKELPTSSDPAVIDWWKGDGSLIDYFNPDAVNWWKGLMDQTLAYGIDGWKCDGTDFSAFQAPYSPGDGGFVSRIDYSHAYYNLHFDYTREVLGDDRVITARPIDNYGIADIGGEQVSFAPVDINFCGWVGDQDATFEGLEWALNNLYHSSEMGYLSHGSDIGGYREDDNYPVLGRSKEVFIRWAQLGAFSGLMENGGSGEHRPWMFDQETVDIYRDLVNTRYEMIHYLMVHSETYFANGESLMDFFNKTDYSFLLGPDIFVTPFLEEGTEITVNFPDDGSNWVYYYDSTQVYAGGSQHTFTIPYSEFPVYFREGTDPLGVKENLRETGIDLYPNPASDVVSIRLDQGFNSGTVQVELFDLQGKLLHSTQTAARTFKVDLSSFDDGIYICRITTGSGGIISNKLVKR